MAPKRSLPDRMRDGKQDFLKILHGSTPNHQHLRDRLVFLWLFTAVLDLIFSVIAYLLETDRPGSELHNYGDALFWTTTQLLTVSSQLANPVTAGGKILDVVMEFVAMTLVTAQAGSLGSFLYRLSMERNPLPHHENQTGEPKPEAGT